MRILIVEDSQEKFRVIDHFIRSEVIGCTPINVKTLADAVRIATTIPFDLIVLDLMIPYLSHGIANSDAGYEFMRQIRQDGMNRHTRVIAISAFPDEIETYRSRFDSMSVLITSYENADVWNSALRVAFSDLMRGNASVDPIDFLIVCALDEERAGFSATPLNVISDASVEGLNIRYVQFGERIGAIMRCSQMGLVTATFEVATALAILNPRILAMSGICAGFSGKAEIGQVVAASLAWEYQAGKWADDRFEIAPLQVPIPSSTRSAIDHLFDRPNYAKQLDDVAAIGCPRPANVYKPIIGPMASGSAVIADDTRLDHIRVQHRKVVALDMETFGVFYAAHESRGRLSSFFSIKAVVDTADSAKGDTFHKYGCRVAALATFDVLEAL